jgi:hypothetical protein
MTTHEPPVFNNDADFTDKSGALCDTDVEPIQHQLNHQVNDLSSKWKASILFCCHVISNPNEVNKELPPVFQPSILQSGYISVQSPTLHPSQTMK